MSKRILVICRQTPYASLIAQEGLELFLLAASFNLVVSLLFLGDGVWQLIKTQNPQQLYRKNLSKSLKSLNMFDINSIYIEKTALIDRNIQTSDLVLPAQVVDADEIQKLLNNHHHVLNF